MSKVWVVAADGSRAQILESPNRVGPLKPVSRLQHPEARMKDSELYADAPGRAFDSAGTGRHAMENEVDAKKMESVRFAKQLCSFLQEKSRAGAFDKLVLAAAPQFLGLLRDNLDKNVREKISAEVDKDLANERPDDIRGHLPDFLY
ncbi:MAG: host attachment protein [Gammaproteobacteria bacterium]|nr:MAG: host attachment protein [Gammaproteobacteria bacterium]